MRIALIGRAYTGKTSIAQELLGRGFELLRFSDFLKGLAAHALNSVYPFGGYTETLLATDKPKYRRFIQELGSLIGFDTTPAWLQGFLLDDMRFDEEAPSYVIDCLRSSVQVEVAREFGFKIVGVWATDSDRAWFAGRWDDVLGADAHPIDGQLSLDTFSPDYVLRNTWETPIQEAVTQMLEALNGQK